MKTFFFLITFVASTNSVLLSQNLSKQNAAEVFRILFFKEALDTTNLTSQDLQVATFFLNELIQRTDELSNPITAMHWERQNIGRFSLSLVKQAKFIRLENQANRLRSKNSGNSVYIDDVSNSSSQFSLRDGLIFSTLTVTPSSSAINYSAPKNFSDGCFSAFAAHEIASEYRKQLRARKKSGVWPSN